MQIFHIVPAPLLELHHLKISAKIANHGDVWRWEPVEHGLSYLDQEGGVQWNESDPPLSYMFADHWSPLADDFPYDHFLESPSAPLTLDEAASTSLGALHKITDAQYDKGSPNEDGAAAADTPSLDPHDGMSDITSTIISTADEEQGSTAANDSIQRPASYGKVPMGVKSSRGSPLKCKWKHCEYSGGFSQMGALLRHIKTKHISPGLYECPEGECRKSFNRKDNLVAHIRNVHRETV
ncbi:Zinc finger, C2H2 [Penicillium expansum]|uniref:Zinc finger, C2H2 n=1 Tax=Penicillium expansum TaxID=27334 RepID=A0A0A2J2Q0_PENEN|nr:Zinc finger, C2H2 [Penicillium expansum]KGO49076.1 Zinc finger, C2H2 [Penicillium expansum]KGO57774.1 Zinc finger, C2H2 [Penicillium expansum]KGO63870.1 Zinc finger, C2H2 [Penicillium expansum]